MTSHKNSSEYYLFDTKFSNYPTATVYAEVKDSSKIVCLLCNILLKTPTNREPSTFT